MKVPIKERRKKKDGRKQNCQLSTINCQRFQFHFQNQSTLWSGRVQTSGPRLYETFPCTDICLLSHLPFLPLLCRLGSASFHPSSFFLMLSSDQFTYILHVFYIYFFIVSLDFKTSSKSLTFHIFVFISLVQNITDTQLLSTVESMK